MDMGKILDKAQVISPGNFPQSTCNIRPSDEEMTEIVARNMEPPCTHHTCPHLSAILNLNKVTHDQEYPVR